MTSDEPPVPALIPTRVFKYDVSTIGAEALIVILGSAFLLWAFFASEDKPSVVIYLGFAIAIVGAWVHGWLFWRSPWKLVLANGDLGAFWPSGTHSTWKIELLRKRGARTWFSGIVGAMEIVDMRGELQFRIWKQMIGSHDLLELIRDE